MSSVNYGLREILFLNALPNSCEMSVSCPHNNTLTHTQITITHINSENTTGIAVLNTYNNVPVHRFKVCPIFVILVNVSSCLVNFSEVEFN